MPDKPAPAESTPPSASGKPTMSTHKKRLSSSQNSASNPNASKRPRIEPPPIPPHELEPLLSVDIWTTEQHAMFDANLTDPKRGFSPFRTQTVDEWAESELVQARPVIRNSLIASFLVELFLCHAHYFIPHETAFDVLEDNEDVSKMIVELLLRNDLRSIRRLKLLERPVVDDPMVGLTAPSEDHFLSTDPWPPDKHEEWDRKMTDPRTGFVHFRQGIVPFAEDALTSTKHTRCALLSHFLKDLAKGPPELRGLTSAVFADRLMQNDALVDAILYYLRTSNLRQLRLLRLFHGLSQWDEPSADLFVSNDPWSDEEHAEWDTKVKTTWPPFAAQSISEWGAYVEALHDPSKHWTLLGQFLTHLVGCGPVPFTKRNYDFQSLLPRNEAVVRAVEYLLSKSDLRRIRLLKALHFPESILGAAERLVDRSLNLEVDRRAYRQGYVGQAHHDMIDKFLADSKRTDLYSRAGVIVQASGCGKSRVLSEVGRLIFTMGFCLRPFTVNGEPSDGYPTADAELVELIGLMPDGQDTHDLCCHFHVTCFLAAVFEEQRRWLLSRATQEKTPLLREWRDLLGDPDTAGEERSVFIKRIVESYKAKTRVIPAGYKVDLVPRSKSGSKPTHTPPIFYSTIKTMYEQYLKPQMVELHRFLERIRAPHCLHLTYFDEAQTWGKRYWVLLRILHNARDLPFFFMFMGTNTQLSFYLPPDDEVASARLAHGNLKLAQPLYVLGFDQFAQSIKAKGSTTTMKELLSFNFVCRFGRPIWLPYLIGLLNSERAGEAEPMLLFMAHIKLFMNTVYDPGKQQHVLALLSILVILTLVMHIQESVTLAHNSVANHLRLITNMRDDYRLFETHTPSEPILALIALMALFGITTMTGRPSPEWTFQATISTFMKSLVHKRLIDKGLMGELLARLLLLLARGSLCLEPGLQSPYRCLREPVRLMDFLDQLMGKMWCTWEARAAFEQAFSEAHINFTHWIQTRSLFPPKPSVHLRTNLFFRQCWVQCQFLQPGFDLFGVAYTGSLDDEAHVKPDRFRDIYISVRFRKDATTDLNDIFPIRELAGDEEYLVILLDLGTKSQFEDRSYIRVTVPEPDESDSPDLSEIQRVQKKLEITKKREEMALEYRILQTKLDSTSNRDERKKLREDSRRIRLELAKAGRFVIELRGLQPLESLLTKLDIVKEIDQLRQTYEIDMTNDKRKQEMLPLDSFNPDAGSCRWLQFDDWERS